MQTIILLRRITVIFGVKATEPFFRLKGGRNGEIKKAGTKILEFHGLRRNLSSLWSARQCIKAHQCR